MCDALLFHNWWVHRDKVDFIIAKLGFSALATRMVQQAGGAPTAATTAPGVGAKAHHGLLHLSIPCRRLGSRMLKVEIAIKTKECEIVWVSTDLTKHVKLLWMKVAAFSCPRFQDGARTFVRTNVKVKVYQGMLDALLCSLSYERRRLQAARTELSVKGGDVHMKLWRLAGIPLTHECMSVKAHLLVVVQVDSAGRTSVSYLLFWRAPERPDSAALKPNPLIYYHELPWAA